MKRRHECSCEKNHTKSIAHGKNLRELSRQVKRLDERLSTVEHAMKELEHFLFEINRLIINPNTNNLRKN